MMHYRIAQNIARRIKEIKQQHGEEAAIEYVEGLLEGAPEEDWQQIKDILVELQDGWTAPSVH